jgi:energy-coupling factor transporter ATP-binding protein EcfA2
MLRFTIKNYRCFSDEHPLVIDYARGFTAVVGPNNSGKSAFLRFIYEHQVLWSHLRDVGAVASMGSNRENYQGYSLRGVVDPEEVICDYTKRPMTFAAEWISPPQTAHMKSLAATTRPQAPVNWNVQIETKPQSPTLVPLAPNRIMMPGGAELAWTAFYDAFDDFNNCLFAPAFRNAINEGAGSYYEFSVGTAVVSQWNTWKAGTNLAAKRSIQKIQSDIKHIFGLRELEINVSADQKTFEVVVNGRPFRLNDLGAGLAQFIILFANVAVRKPALLLIDEPELNLHPSLQIDFLTALASYTTSGSVIFATHSLGLARAVADRIYSFSPGDRGTIVRPLESTPNYAQFAGEMGFGSYQVLGFKTILLVEGPTEVKAVQQFLRLLGHDHDVITMPLGGSTMIAPGREVELGELLRITDKVAVLIDSERKAEGGPIAADRAEFVRDCAALDFMVHVTERRAFENYLTNTAIQEVKGGKYRALKPYEALSSLSPAWDKNENWRIARAMTLEDLRATDVGQFLQKVCTVT